VDALEQAEEDEGRAEGPAASPEEETYIAYLEGVEEDIERLKELGSAASGAGAGLIAQAKSLAAMGQFADACARLEAAHDLLSDALEQAEGPAVNPDAEAEPAEGEAPAGSAPAALAAWQAARDQVVADIRKAAAAIAATRDPYARGAIIELQAVIKNLTPKPDTPQAVAELQRYLQTDPVVADVEGLPAAVATLRVRQPLLSALAALKA
jgi:hypothetical protein